MIEDNVRSHRQAEPSREPAEPRVSLITLHRVHNFGSVLQTYATQELLRSRGFDVEVADYRRPSEHVGFAAQMNHNYARWNRNTASRTAFWLLRSRQLQREAENFDNFVRRRIALGSREYLRAEDLKADPPVADVYCVGSDQVWNNDYHARGSEEPYYLNFAPEGSPRFSIASSFGKTHLSATDADLTRRALEHFEGLTVREKSGVDILKQLGIEAASVVDPTLAQPPSFWDALAEEPSVSGDYILVYQLHRRHNLGPIVAKVKRELGLPVVTVRGYWAPDPRARGFHNTAVEQFVGLVSNARHVVTDSFHGTAFSLNTRTSFTAVLPPKYSERISNILELTCTQSRAFTIGQDVVLDFDEIDWSAVESRLSTERLKLQAFIDRMIEV